LRGAKHLEIEGEPVPLPAGVDLTAYRLVQEGLTNAIKHAAARHPEVRFRYDPGHVEIEVCDDGRGVDGADSTSSEAIGGVGAPDPERPSSFCNSNSLGPPPLVLLAFIPCASNTRTVSRTRELSQEEGLSELSIGGLCGNAGDGSATSRRALDSHRAHRQACHQSGDHCTKEPRFRGKQRPT
jgi:hypothetical protein